MMRRSWARGTPVLVALDAGASVHGQVWAQAPADGEAWLALDGGVFLIARKSTGEVLNEHGHRVGKVAA